jgi:hypothetical protein
VDPRAGLSLNAVILVAISLNIDQSEKHSYWKCIFLQDLCFTAHILIFLYLTPFFVKSDDVPSKLQRTDSPVYELVSWGGVRLSPLGMSATTGLLYQDRMTDDECGALDGMRICRGNRSTRRKAAPVPLCPPQIPHNLTWARTRTAVVRSRRLTAGPIAHPFYELAYAIPCVGNLTGECPVSYVWMFQFTAGVRIPEVCWK